MARRCQGNNSHVTAMRCLLLLMTSNCLYLLTSGNYQQQISVQCITDKQQAEISLHCKNRALINILSAQVGNQELPQDQLICIPHHGDDCMVNIPDLGPLYKRCMALSTCNMVINTPREDRCANVVNFIQIYYQCIPVPVSDTSAIIDICGDGFIGHMTSITRNSGYITSLHYPRGYTPLASCSCNLTALDPDTNIRFQTLDIDLSPRQRLTVGHDWLEYTQTLDQWGDGYKLNHVIRGDFIDTELPVVYLNFRTGAAVGGRGFWIQYYGVAGDGRAADINLHCGQFTPSDYKSDISCFADSSMGELYLSCQSQGIINILSAVQGYSPLITQSNCTMDQSTNCTRIATQDAELLKKCMGHMTCNPPARPIPLNCGRKSNFMYVLYQCIAVDAMERSAHIDICGDATNKQTIRRNSGYLETLNYPEGYIPDQKCTCRLETLDDDTEIVLSLVDIDLDTNECAATKDWIEFTSGRQNWAKGVRLCGNVPGEPIHTGTQKLYLNFYSDLTGNGRGVWLKYMGKRADDTLVDVYVTCGLYSPDRDLPELINTDIPPYYTGPNTEKISKSGSHTGLIVGLTITAMFMVAMVTFIVVFKYKRPRKQPEETAPGGPPSTIARLDTGYGTLKYPGFSTRKNGHGMPYTNLDEDLERSDKVNEFHDTSPIIPGTSDILDLTKPECSSASNGSSTSGNSSEPTSVRSEMAYSNPAFDGEWQRDQEYTENLRNGNV